jgi:excinuclease UvrABC nuclease subunit
VYAFLDEQGMLLYVGKASFRNSIAARLSTYCMFEAGKGTPCRLNHQWKTKPRYVVTVAVPEETRFEASAVEEFLITRLEPPENSIGIGPNA